jgi:AraC-like DNA-binding protein/ligand-binding sensor protein
MPDLKDYGDFDMRLAEECALAYSDSSGLGCTVSDIGGKVLFEAGYGCAGCGICGAAGLPEESCIKSHAYGMTEAERFGGKYIYFCPMGLTCFVSPIMGQEGSAAKITAGPFLMVDREDYFAFDLQERLKLGDEAIRRVLALVDKLPCIPAGKVNSLSILLFMAVGFMNDVSAANRMLDRQGSGLIQGQITEYIMELKLGEEPPGYPIKTEKALLSSIAFSDKQAAGKHLNELLGYILLSSGGNFSEIKSRIIELLTLISRAAVDAGAGADETFRMNHSFYQKAAVTSNIDDLCFLLTGFMNKYIDSLFSFSSVKNADVVSKAIHYMRLNCHRKMGLDDVAKSVFLAPAYFGKVFKQETGQNFNMYLNKLRVEKSRRMLLESNHKLVDIASHSGFEDQSYFSKVFKKLTGVSPGRYRKSGGRNMKQSL